MKQNITIEQLQELSEKGLTKLAMISYEKGWATLNPIKQMPNGDGTFTPTVEPARLDCLSIGQMIEFLSFDKCGYIDDTFDKVIYGNGEYFSNVTHVAIGWNDKEELCDALWEAVKEVLEK